MTCRRDELGALDAGPMMAGSVGILERADGGGRHGCSTVPSRSFSRPEELKN